MSKTEKAVGILLAVVSALILTGSVAGFFLVDCLPERAGIPGESPFYRQTLENGKPIALLFTALSLGSLLAGIFITSHKHWARVLGQVIAMLYLAYIWHQALLVAGAGVHAVRALLGSLPLLLLIGYLAKEQVRSRLSRGNGLSAEAALSTEPEQCPRVRSVPGKAPAS